MRKVDGWLVFMTVVNKKAVSKSDTAFYLTTGVIYSGI
jgi:hypothetical protein